MICKKMGISLSGGDYVIGWFILTAIMEELNSLISPCKKLRLESCDITDSAGTIPDVDSHIEAVDSKVVGSEIEDVAVGVHIDNGETASLMQVQSNHHICTEISDIQNGTNESSHNKEQSQIQIHSSNATAMLVKMDDAVAESINNEHDGVVKCSAELLHAPNEMLSAQDTVTTSECKHKQLDLNESSSGMTEYEEFQNLLQGRRNEVMQLCSGVKVSAIIKQMECGETVKTDVDDAKCGSAEELNAFEIVKESVGCTETDEMNISDRTIIDESEECCTERLEISGASESDKDTAPNGTDYRQDHLSNEHNLSNEHVYANVIINAAGADSVNEVELMNQKERNVNDDICPESNSDAILCNNEIGRTSGDGAEVLEDTGRYFSVVDDDSDSDIGADGVEVEEETTNYFCTLQEIENNVNSHYLYDIKEEKDCFEPNVDSTIITADRLNNTEVELTRTTSYGQPDPLCSSTPLRPKLGTNSIENKFSNESYQLSFINSFKPSADCKPKGVARNSQPLLTSTPLLKPYQGLKVRDMNIMHAGDKFTTESKQKVYEFDQKREENIGGNAEIINENDGVGMKRKLFRRHSFSDQSLRGNRDSKREKKKNKGVRKEKFKEYMGPGLTVGISSEDASQVDGGVSKKDFVKNSDIETCTLIEYKGFGLTGPLPERPLLSSTPMPTAWESEKNAASTDNINGLSSVLTSEKTNLTRCLSGVSLGGRAAGTEGMLTLCTKPEIPKLRQTVSETRFGQKMMSGPVDLRRKTLTRHNSDLGPQSHSKHSRLTGWLASVQAHRPQTLLPPLLEGPAPSTSIPLKPDEVYPGVMTGHVGASSIGGSSKTEKSESNSNTDKSDKSDKAQFVDPAVLQSQGKQKIQTQTSSNGTNYWIKPEVEQTRRIL